MSLCALCSDVLFRHRRKCQLNKANVNANGSGSDGNVSPDDSTGPHPSRVKARQDARPYPSLNDEEQNNGNGASLSNKSAATHYGPPGVTYIMDPRHGAHHVDGNNDFFLTGSSDNNPGDLPIPPELLPSLNGNVLLPRGISVNDLHPFYPSILVDSRQPNVNEVMRDLDFPDTHQFPSYNGGSGINKSSSSSAVTRKSFSRFYNEPLVWDEDNSTDSPPSSSDGSLIEPELTLLSTELEICRQKCGPQKLDISNPF